jgi:hypothetical protein
VGGVEARLGRELLEPRERVPRTSSAQPRLYQHQQSPRPSTESDRGLRGQDVAGWAVLAAAERIARGQSSAGQVFSMMRAPLRRP